MVCVCCACEKIILKKNSLYPIFVENYQKCANKGWSFERVLGFELKDKDLRKIQLTNRFACMQACLSEREFICRSVNYDPDTGDCTLSDMDRGSINPTHDLKMRTFGPSSSGSIEYIENNCIEGLYKLFKILKKNPNLKMSNNKC